LKRLQCRRAGFTKAFVLFVRFVVKDLGKAKRHWTVFPKESFVLFASFVVKDL